MTQSIPTAPVVVFYGVSDDLSCVTITTVVEGKITSSINLTGEQVDYHVREMQKYKGLLVAPRMN